MQWRLRLFRAFLRTNKDIFLFAGTSIIFKLEFVYIRNFYLFIYD